MAEQNPKKRSKSAIVLSLGIAFFILVILPAASIFYMNKGVNYRMNQLNKLKKLDSLTAISGIRLDGEQYGAPYFEDKIILMIPEEQLCDEKYRDVFSVIYNKLHKNKGVAFFVKPNEDKNCSYWKSEMKAAFVMSPTENQELYTKLNSLESRKLMDAHTTVLVDRNKYIARAYKLDTKEDLELLLTHVTIMLPSRKTI